MNKPKLLLLLVAFAAGLAPMRQAAATDAPAPPAAPAAPAVASAPAPAKVDAAAHPKGSLTITRDGKHSVTIKAEIKTKDDKPAAGTDAESGADKSAADGGDGDAADDKDDGDGGHRHGRSGDSIVNVGSDSMLEAGRHADAVVAVMGNATSAGDVNDAVVAVMGDARSTGTVGDSVVAVLGNNYVDGPVKGDVVAALGNVELGPNAVVEGQVVAVGGALKRDPGAIVHGEVQEVNIFGAEGVSRVGAGLHAWIRHCLLLGRPLAFAPGLAWAWELAAVYLAGYLLIALLFPTAMQNCLETMARRPGRSVLAAILAVPLKYIAFILLAVTGVGVLLMPFLGIALWLGGALGKAVAFAWIGRRLLPRTESREAGPLVLATLVGALVATVFYVVPFVGFFVYKALAVLGLGIVAYTLILHWFPEGRQPGVGGRGGPTGLPPAGGHPAGAQPADAAAASAAAAAAGTSAAAMAAESVATDAGPAPAAGASASAAPGAYASAAPAGSAPYDASGMERASFWLRMGALAIDFALVAIALGFLPLVDSSVGRCIALTAVYGAIMWKLRGTTVGGVICHLRIARLDGQPIDWSTAIVRALGCFLSLLAAGVGFLWIIWDPERQAWHDKIAGTVVVRDVRSRPLV
jgi:uncharacterized RDD family membrane protein YckC/cytoskeletal protein CcmA (bactofilin family)